MSEVRIESIIFVVLSFTLTCKCILMRRNKETFDSKKRPSHPHTLTLCHWSPPSPPSCPDPPPQAKTLSSGKSWFLSSTCSPYYRLHLTDWAVLNLSRWSKDGSTFSSVCWEQYARFPVNLSVIGWTFHVQNLRYKLLEIDRWIKLFGLSKLTILTPFVDRTPTLALSRLDATRRVLKTRENSCWRLVLYVYPRAYLTPNAHIATSSFRFLNSGSIPKLASVTWNNYIDAERA